jgi:hypothetical protein
MAAELLIDAQEYALFAENGLSKPKKLRHQLVHDIESFLLVIVYALYRKFIQGLKSSDLLLEEFENSSFGKISLEDVRRGRFALFQAELLLYRVLCHRCPALASFYHLLVHGKLSLRYLVPPQAPPDDPLLDLKREAPAPKPLEVEAVEKVLLYVIQGVKEKSLNTIRPLIATSEIIRMEVEAELKAVHGAIVTMQILCNYDYHY